MLLILLWVTHPCICITKIQKCKYLNNPVKRQSSLWWCTVYRTSPIICLLKLCPFLTMDCKLIFKSAFFQSDNRLISFLKFYFTLMSQYGRKDQVLLLYIAALKANKFIFLICNSHNALKAIGFIQMFLVMCSLTESNHESWKRKKILSLASAQWYGFILSQIYSVLR